MKLFLDAHVSGRRVAGMLRERGHDVRAADEERSLDGATDEELLALSAEEGRIMVTFNVRDFPRIAREWAEGGRHHAGCAVVVGIDHSQFGAILRLIDEAADARPDQESWQDYTCFLSRGGA